MTLVATQNSTVEYLDGSEKWTEQNVEGCSSDLILSNVLESIWREWGESRKTSIVMAVVVVDIRTGPSQIISQKHCYWLGQVTRCLDLQSGLLPWTSTTRFDGEDSVFRNLQPLKASRDTPTFMELEGTLPGLRQSATRLNHRHSGSNFFLNSYLPYSCHMPCPFIYPWFCRPSKIAVWVRSTMVSSDFTVNITEEGWEIEFSQAFKIKEKCRIISKEIRRYRGK
jgi:hypothetical protein